MRVVVVGGGFGGLASAARLAKLGHAVTLVEASDRPGGALRTVEADGFVWQGSATTLLVPGVVRDLFRKSGRPLERELELVEQPVIREHRFSDGTTMRLPGGSRSAQLSAFDRLGPGLGTQWCDYVAAYSEDWALLRRDYLERRWIPELAPPELGVRLLTRESLHRRIRSSLTDVRLRQVAGFTQEFGGHRLRDVPSWAGFTVYL